MRISDWSSDVCSSDLVRNLGTPVFPKTLFDAVLDVFGEDADILTVRHAETPVASVLSIYWRGTVMTYWGGGTFAARGLRANEIGRAHVCTLVNNAHLVCRLLLEK